MNNPNTQRLLAALTPKTEQFDVAGFGPVLIRQLTVGQADQARAEADKVQSGGSEFGLRLLLTAVTELDGSPLLDDADLPALRDSGNTAVEALVTQVLKVNGFRVAGAPNA